MSQETSKQETLEEVIAEEWHMKFGNADDPGWQVLRKEAEFFRRKMQAVEIEWLQKLITEECQEEAIGTGE